MIHLHSSFDVYDNYASANLSNLSCLLAANKGGKYYEIRDVDITITGNQVKVKCPNTITQIAGILKLELWFLDNTNSLKKSSFDINIKVNLAYYLILMVMLEKQ